MVAFSLRPLFIQQKPKVKAREPLHLNATLLHSAVWILGLLYLIDWEWFLEVRLSCLVLSVKIT